MELVLFFWTPFFWITSFFLDLVLFFWTPFFWISSFFLASIPKKKEGVQKEKYRDKDRSFMTSSQEIKLIKFNQKMDQIQKFWAQNKRSKKKEEIQKKEYKKYDKVQEKEEILFLDSFLVRTFF